MIRSQQKAPRRKPGQNRRVFSRRPATVGNMLVLGFMAVCLGAICPDLRAGTPENLLLLVNENSDSSKLIANHYIRWRNIPPSNVVYLRGIPDRVQITVEQFRELILKPTIEQIEQRQLAAQIDYIVYSSGFPTKIQCRSDREKLDTGSNPDADKILRPIVSISSATYMLAPVLAGNPVYFGLDNNWYYRDKGAQAFNKMFAGEDQQQYEQGVAAYRRGNFQSALDAWLELTKTYAAHDLLWIQVARAYAQLEQSDAALAALATAEQAGWKFGKTTRLDPAFRKLSENPEFGEWVGRLPMEEFDYMPSRGFRSRYRWLPNGVGIDDAEVLGQKYFLSTVLAVTNGRGNTDEEGVEVSAFGGRGRRDPTSRHVLFYPDQGCAFQDSKGQFCRCDSAAGDSGPALRDRDDPGTQWEIGCAGGCDRSLQIRLGKIAEPNRTGCDLRESDQLWWADGRECHANAVDGFSAAWGRGFQRYGG